MPTFDEWLEKNYPAPTTVAKQKLLASSDVNPQAAAKSIRIAREEGIPIAFAPSEPDPQSELQLKLRKNVDAIDESPTLWKWLGKQPPIVVGAVNDDIENLSNLDAVAQEFKNIAGAVASSAPAFNAGAWGLVRAAGEALPDVLGQPVAGLAKQYAEQQKALADDLMPQGGNLFSQSVYGGLQSAGLSLMTLPFGLAAGPTAMMAPALTQVLGDSYTKARDEGLSGTRALTHAIEIAGLEYVSEKIPAGRLIDDLVQGTGLGQTLLRQLAAELPGEQFATLTQDFTEWANLNPDKSLKQFVEERPEAALSTAIATLTGTTTTVLTAKGVERIASRVLRDDEKLREANDSGAALQKMAEMVAATETAKRDVETFEGFLQSAFEGSAADNVYIDANILRDSGLAPVLAQKSETVADQMEQAAAGTMVRIPIAEVMGRFNQELQPLLPDLRVTPEGLSQREAENYMAEEGNALQALVERALQQDAQDEAIAQQRTQIADEIAAQIEETGRARPEVAALYGRLVASFYATQAQRIGMTPMQLWESRKLKVEKGNMVLAPEKEATELLQQVFHGSPYAFTDFDASKIGTGEGAQAFGYGLYFAESQKVANAYQQNVTALRMEIETQMDAEAAVAKKLMIVFGKNDGLKQIKRTFGDRAEAVLAKANEVTGFMYTVEIPDDVVDRMLDYDKPINEQNDYVKSALENAGINTESSALAGQMAQGQEKYLQKFGIPGIKYFDEKSRERGEGTRNFVVFPGEESNVKILKREQGFAQEKEKLIRGSFAPNELTIRLTKASDLSTFLHESGHLFFHMMADLASQPNANAAIAKDTDALLKWVGIEPTPEQSRAEVWNSMPIAEQDQYHEMMARGFEVYLSEGKAPSVELRSAFATFRAWLLNVYKQILQAAKTGGMQKALNVQLNAEVRSVMDRLLATEEEIEAAEAMASMGMMFGSQAEAEKFKLDWQAYQAQGKAATDEAVSELGARSIKDMKWLDNAKSRMLRKLQKEEKALRSEARIEARREVLQQPVYRALAFLTAPIRSELAERRQELKKNFRSVDPSKDSILVAIAKLGGIKDLPGEFGFDPADLKRAVKEMELGPSFTLSGKNSRSADAMGEALFDLGYLTEDEFGRYDVTEMEKKIADSLSGNDHYSMRFDYDAYFAADQIIIDEESENWGGRIRTDRAPELFKEALKAKGVMRKVGDSPDVIAELYGFSSGMELMQRLAEAPSPRDAIEQRTDQIMLERHSELATPEARNEAVNAALANDARTKMVATEMNALERATRGGKGRATPAAAAKAFAEQILARMKIIDIRPTQFSASAARAAKAADKARKKGDIAEAAIEKRNELVNLHATKLATDAKAELQKGLDYIARLKGKSARQKIDITQLDQIDNILELYEFKRVSAAELERRQSLTDWIAQQEEEGFVVDIPDKVRNRARATNFQTLSLEDFRGVIDSLKQIEHIGRLKTKLLLSAKNREISEVVAKVKNEIAQNKTLKPLDDRARSTVGAQLKQAFKAFTASHRKMASIVYQIDNFKLGPLWESLVRTANERSDWEANKQAELTQRLAKLQKLVKKDFGFSKGQFFSGINDSLTTDERLVVALNWGNLGNRQRLLDGRGWTVEGVQQVLDTLTENEWKYVQGVWETFDSLRPEIAAKERKLMNKEPDWIEPAEVQTKYGTLKGGYYPIVYDTRLSGKAAQDESAEAAKRQLQSARIAAQTRRGYVKSRAEKVTDRPVLLTTDGMFRGLNDVVHDLAFHEWAIDANRLTKALDPVIRQAYGADLMNQILSAKDAIIAGENIQPTGLDRFLRRIRVGSMVNGLGFGMTTALMQPLGLTQSMVRVGKIPVLKAVAKFAGNPVAISKDVLSKSAMMRNRATTRDRELNELRNGLRKTNDVRQFIDRAMFVPMAMMQMTVDIPTWLASYEKAIIAGQAEATAIAMADSDVLAAQGGGQLKDLAAIQRGPEALKLFTVFYGYMNTLYNVTAEQVRKTNFKNPLEVASLSIDMLLLYVIPSMLVTLLKDALGGGDDDDEKLAERMALENVSFLFGTMVGVREVAGAAQMAAAEALDAQTPYFARYQGPAGLRFFSELQNSMNQATQGEIDRAFTKTAINLGGILLHLPGAQINRTIDGFNALIEGETDNPAALIGGAR